MVLQITLTTKLVRPSYDEAASVSFGPFSLKEPSYNISISGQPGDTVAEALERGRVAELKLVQDHDRNCFEQSLKLAADEGFSLDGARNLQLYEHRFCRGEKLTTGALPLVFNCIFYLAAIPNPIEPSYSPDAPLGLIDKIEKANSAKRKRILSEELEQRGYTKVRFVRDPRPTEEHSALPTGRTLQTHWRRGHWRLQPIGPGLQKLALKWIRPCLVNPDKGEPKVGRVYDVREEHKGE